MPGSNNSNPPPRPFRLSRRPEQKTSPRRSAFSVFRSPKDSTPTSTRDSRTQDDAWRDVTRELLAAGGRRRLTRRLAWEWSLVFEARRLNYRLERSLGGYAFHAPVASLQRLEEEIQAYERENRDRAPSRPVPTQENTVFTVGIILLLGLFHGVAQNQWRLFGFDAANAPIPWVDKGACDCFELLVKGAWWRGLTALTLHADAAHLVGNMGIGMLVMAPLCRELGSGPGWFLTILAGFLGNVLNCWAQGYAHLSLGASTAVFGAIGLLSSLRSVREQHWNPRAVLLPLGAGVALLAFLGIGEDPTIDVGAHVFGFLVGLALGAGVGLAIRRFGPPGKKLSLSLGLLAMAAPVLAWFMALQ